MNYNMSMRPAYPPQQPWSNLSQIGANNYGLVQTGKNAWLNQNSTGGWQSRIDSFGRNTGGLQTGGHNLIANSYNGGNTWFDQSNANQQFANIYGGNFNVNQSYGDFGQGNFYGGQGNFNTDYINNSNAWFAGSKVNSNQNRGFYASAFLDNSQGNVNQIGNQYANIQNTNGTVNANQVSGYANYATNGPNANGNYNQQSNFNNFGNFGGNVNNTQNGFASTAYNVRGTGTFSQQGGAFATAVNGAQATGSFKQGNLYNNGYNASAAGALFDQYGYKNALVAYPGSNTEAYQRGSINDIWSYGQAVSGVQHGQKNTALI